MGDSRAYVRPAPRAWPGRCRRCNRKRDVYPVQRHGGGTYRRPGRFYSSSICAECVVELGPYLPAIGSGHHNVGSLHWDASEIRRILESLRLPEDAP